jgi:hypothetical protein
VGELGGLAFATCEHLNEGDGCACKILRVRIHQQHMYCEPFFYTVSVLSLYFKNR